MNLDGIVTAKRDYEGELTHLKVRPVKNNEAMEARARTREEVIEAIQNQAKTYYLAQKDEENHYVLGRKLRVVRDGSNRYLRTDDSPVPADSLESLPNF